MTVSADAGPTTEEDTSRPAMLDTAPNDRRAHPRYRVAPMYTVVAARRRGHGGDLLGHLYDISQGGARIELDEEVAAGETLAVQLELPGEASAVRAQGQVVWVADREDDPGPRRLALRFIGFETPDHEQRLVGFLREGGLRTAA